MGLSLAKTVTRLAVLLWNTAGLAITGRPSKALCNIAEAMAAESQHYWNSRREQDVYSG